MAASTTHENSVNKNLMTNEAAFMEIKNTSLEKLGEKAQCDNKKGIKANQNVGIHKSSNAKLITNHREPLFSRDEQASK